MANSSIFFSDFKSGRCSSTVQVCFLQIAPVLGDHDGSHHECQPACYLHAKRLQSFDVTRCNQNFRLLDSSLLIRFRDTNSLDEVTEPVKPNVVFERGLEGLLDNMISAFQDKATDLIDEDGSLVRPCHAQIPEEARELEKQLRQIT
uniref:Uncharacterized protein n=2 Tax=Brassica oleracea TaxID=3712 RepID=A0A0D3BKR3_BRAOL|nr:unnamed protein product [Brassica oleracea]